MIEILGQFQSIHINIRLHLRTEQIVIPMVLHSTIFDTTLTKVTVIQEEPCHRLTQALVMQILNLTFWIASGQGKSRILNMIYGNPNLVNTKMINFKV